MRFSVTLFMLVVLAHTSFGQIYTYISSVGQRQFVSDLRPNAVNVYPPPKDNVLSDWQTLPFAWNFFGKPVSGFFISDNGYITFHNTATVSDPRNVAIPSASAPLNAIFAFWEDLHTQAGFSQWSNEVRTLLWGAAPNRVLVIMWTGVAVAGAPYSTANTLAFCVALHEGGDFDVVFVGGSTTMRTSATVGAQNEDGTVGIMVEGSPSFVYPAVTADPNDDISYRFTSAGSGADLGFNQHWLPQITKINVPIEVRGTLKNFGGETVNSFDLSYSVDGGDELTDIITGVNIPSNGIYNFTHTTAWTPAAAGRFYDLRLRISNVNGQSEDGNPANDVATARVFTQLGISAEKRPLVEEFTGAWCGWCPDGALQLQAIESALPLAVLLAVHAGGVDSMIVPEGASIASAFTPAYPQAMIDRTLFPGQVKVPISRGGNAWLIRAQQQTELDAPVWLDIKPAFDPATRTATIDVSVNFDDFLYPGDARLNVFLVEDRVSGFGRGWDQANYYSNNSSYPNHPYYSETNPIVGFVHRHVVRASLTGAWGAQIPEGIQAGSSWERQYIFTLPVSWKESDVNVVAFVAYHDADVKKRPVVNAADKHLTGQTSVSGIAPSAFHVDEVHPNPASGSAMLRLDLQAASRLRVEIFDALGRSVLVAVDSRRQEGVHTIPLSLHGLRGGAYLARITTDGMSVVRRMLISR